MGKMRARWTRRSMDHANFTLVPAWLSRGISALVCHTPLSPASSQETSTWRAEERGRRLEGDVLMEEERGKRKRNRYLITRVQLGVDGAAGDAALPAVSHGARLVDSMEDEWVGVSWDVWDVKTIHVYAYLEGDGGRDGVLVVELVRNLEHGVLAGRERRKGRGH